MNQRLGTPYYIAPEVLQSQYDNKCDIWSCGVILYIMLSGILPFNGTTNDEIVENVKQGKLSFENEEWNYISQQAKNFIRKMLELDPTQRLSASQALQDPWIKKFNNNQNLDFPNLYKSIENMKNFNADKKLQEATLIFFINNFASNEEKNQMLKVFQGLDINGDGKISQQELIEGFEKIYEDKNLAKIEAQKVFQSVDRNNSGEIDYTEWIMATINTEQLLSKQRINAAFQMFDKLNRFKCLDRNGKRNRSQWGWIKALKLPKTIA
ncbi:protein kinase domain protein [Ichthyophthirius multifiliis]|uniref:Protein kinase domain protein n=1 Tax=Ichthyophthirius multifiliis TaxID=5932 RepID=G0QN77_ICHMU|nr:protein kinase domain protein [Ichthyophthirius multifiliis]EGR33331.1 protein kinase domain protein [Ichthyophthirius multifiliis]|eukprot:XP_004037317.1 protein kinase domain protein [Ichthyophthirius multifiliis]